MSDTRDKNRVNFKKNIKKLKPVQPNQEETYQLTDQTSWFVNTEDRLFKGTDYFTKEEDLHKLIKYLKVSLTKHDFYRYETTTDSDQVKSLVISTTQMKENYLMFKDCLMICPCVRTRAENRFNL